MLTVSDYGSGHLMAAMLKEFLLLKLGVGYGKVFC